MADFETADWEMSLSAERRKDLKDFPSWGAVWAVVGSGVSPWRLSLSTSRAW